MSTRAPVWTRLVPVLAVLLVLVGCAGSSGGAPEAGCAGPQVSVTPTRAAPGDDVRVRARFLFSDCYDTGQQGTPPPLRDVQVTFTADGRTVPLTTVDAEPDGTVDTTVRVPGESSPGPAQITVQSAATDFTVEAPGS